MSLEIADLFRLISTGVYVIGVKDGNGSGHAFTASWVTQVSFDPLMIALSINPQNRSYSMLKDRPCFSINVLNKNQIEEAEHFFRDTDRLQSRNWRRVRTGAPVLDSALAWFDCQLVGDYPAGDHRIVTGIVIAAGSGDCGNVQPMLYSDTGTMDQSAALFPKKT